MKNNTIIISHIWRNFMDFQDNELFIILDKIEKMKGWGLFFDPVVNKGLCSEFMLQLEKGGFIIINGKNINENNFVEYNHLEFTEKGRNFYVVVGVGCCFWRKIKRKNLWGVVGDSCSYNDVPLDTKPGGGGMVGV